MDDIADFLSFVPGMAAMLSHVIDPWQILLVPWLLFVFSLRVFWSVKREDGYYNGLPTNYMTGLAAPVLLLSGTSTRWYALAVFLGSCMSVPMGRLWYTHPKLLESQAWKKALFVVLLTLVTLRVGVVFVFGFFLSYAFLPKIYAVPQKRTAKE